jgi:hypothetical protein
MVGPFQDLSVDNASGPRWEFALSLLQSGEGVVNFRGLVLSCDPAMAKGGRRLHVEFDCPFDPSLVGKSQHDRLGSLAKRDLERASPAHRVSVR